jgi:hypothetical protein
MADILPPTADDPRFLAVLETLIPANAPFPSAADGDLPARVLEDIAAEAAEGRVQILLAALPTDFVVQSTGAREALLAETETKFPAEFATVLRHVYNAYYSAPLVRDVLEDVDGYPARPPNYAGYELDPFNDASLAAQRQRAPFWRKV